MIFFLASTAMTLLQPKKWFRNTDHGSDCSFKKALAGEIISRKRVKELYKEERVTPAERGGLRQERASSGW